MRLILSYFILYTINQIYSYEVINKLPLGMGLLDIESIEYDKVNKQYIIASWYYSGIFTFDEEVIEDTEYNVTDTQYNDVVDFNGIPVPTNGWRNPVELGGSGAGAGPFSNGDLTLGAFTWRPAGMEIVDRVLYVVDFYNGLLAAWDLETQTYTQSITVTNTDGLPANLDGLCHDPANPNMLYSTDFGYIVDQNNEFVQSGYEAVYAIDTYNWTWDRIYDVNMTVEGAENGNYTIRPNGCVVVDGILYTVDSDMQHERPQGFCQYDIEEETWSVEYDLLAEGGGDGLVYIDEIKTFFTTDFENGTLSKYNPKFDDEFVVVQSGMITPADMAYNEESRVLAIPELNTGYVYFIELDEVLFATTEYFTSTMDTTDPDKEPDHAEMMRVVMAFCVCLIMALIV